MLREHWRIALPTPPQDQPGVRQSMGEKEEMGQKERQDLGAPTEPLIQTRSPEASLRRTENPQGKRAQALWAAWHEEESDQAGLMSQDYET